MEDCLDSVGWMDGQPNVGGLDSAMVQLMVLDSWVRATVARQNLGALALVRPKYDS